MKALKQPRTTGEDLPSYLRPLHTAGTVHFDATLCTAGELARRRRFTAEFSIARRAVETTIPVGSTGLGHPARQPHAA